MRSLRHQQLQRLSSVCETRRRLHLATKLSCRWMRGLFVHIDTTRCAPKMHEVGGTQYVQLEFRRLVDDVENGNGWTGILREVYTWIGAMDPQLWRETRPACRDAFSYWASQWWKSDSFVRVFEKDEHTRVKKLTPRRLSSYRGCIAVLKWPAMRVSDEKACAANKIFFS